MGAGWPLGHFSTLPIQVHTTELWIEHKSLYWHCMWEWEQNLLVLTLQKTSLGQRSGFWNNLNFVQIRGNLLSLQPELLGWSTVWFTDWRHGGGAQILRIAMHGKSGFCHRFCWQPPLEGAVNSAGSLATDTLFLCFTNCVLQWFSPNQYVNWSLYRILHVIPTWKAGCQSNDWNLKQCTSNTVGSIICLVLTLPVLVQIWAFKTFVFSLVLFTLNAIPIF